MGARLVVAALLALVLTGCGSDEEPSAERSAEPSSASASEETATATPSSTAPPTPKIPAGAPRCAKVWVQGATLPGDYKGCVRGEKYVKAEVLSCSSGQGIVRFYYRFWAVRGGPITQAADIVDDQAYLDAVARCRG